ncbi:MAG: hypothetical protein AB7F19_03465 [Candidatus Babeliales bacterium]
MREFRITTQQKNSLYITSCIFPESEKDIAEEFFDDYSDTFSACNYQVAIYAITFKSISNRPFTEQDLIYLKWNGPTVNIIAEVSLETMKQEVREFVSFTENWDRLEDHNIINERVIKFWMIVNNYVQISKCKIYQYCVHHDHPDMGIFQTTSFALVDQSRGLFLFMVSFD